jgi:hypothetical protein
MKKQPKQPKPKVAQQAEADTSENDLIGYGVIFTGLVVSLLCTGLAGTAKAALANADDLQKFSLVNVLSTIYKTLPFSVAVTLIVFCVLRDWIDGSIGGLIKGLAIAVACTIILHPKGMGAGFDMIARAWEKTSGNPLFGYPVSLAIRYMEVYEWKLLLSGLLCGGLGGWAMWLKTSKYLDKT